MSVAVPPLRAALLDPEAAPSADHGARASDPGVFATQLAAARTIALPSVGLATMVEARASSASPVAMAATPTTATPTTAAPAVTAAGAGTTPPGSDTGAAALAAGENYLGVPYRWGGTDPATGLDCSGFVQRAFADVGVQLPRVSVDQAKAGTEVGALADARPGDLVFWHGDGRRPNHIGIYAGDGRMLVAPRTGDVVRYQDISRTPDTIRRIT